MAARQIDSKVGTPSRGTGWLRYFISSPVLHAGFNWSRRSSVYWRIDPDFKKGRMQFIQSIEEAEFEALGKLRRQFQHSEKPMNYSDFPTVKHSWTKIGLLSFPYL